MDNTIDLKNRFPELQDPELTISRLAEAFVAPEYARAAFGLMRSIIQRYRDGIRFGQTTVITAPYDYEPVFMTIGSWWFFIFHTANVEELEAGEDVEPIVPLDYPTILRRQRDEHADDVAEQAEEGDDVFDASANDDDDNDDDDDDEVYESTFYQVGTFLLDSTVIPHETIFEREDIDCYAYDYPEERIEAERFYWARMVWEPEDLGNEDLLAAIQSSAEFLVANTTEA